MDFKLDEDHHGNRAISGHALIMSASNPRWQQPPLLTSAIKATGVHAELNGSQDFSLAGKQKLPSSFIQAWDWHSKECCGGVKVFLYFYLPRHKVGVAGNVLMSETVHGICTASLRCPVSVSMSVCLQILSSFNIYGMDKATSLKFGN